MTEQQQSRPKPYVREAKFPEDYDAILEVSRRAFQLDPVFVFWGNITEIAPTGLKEKDDKRLLTWLSFLLRCCIDIKARIVVVVLPEEGGGEKIISSAYWMPPKRRIEVHHFRRMIRAGFIPLFRAWGFTGFDYLDISHKAFKDALKKRGYKSSAVDNAAWHLALAMTDPEYQDQGFLSMIVREQFEREPEGVYLLEATTPRNRDRYAHLGFEVHKPFILGGGKAGADGLPAKGDAATGMEVSPMVKWPASSSSPSNEN